jgi:CBS domain containing-hemolysin-like protein
MLISVAVVAGLFFSAFFSGAETGLYRVNRLRLHLGVHQEDPRAVRLSRVLQDEQSALSVALVGTNVMNYITTAAVAYMFADLLGFSETDTELYTVILLTPIVFVFGEVVPKNLFRLHADSLMARGSGLLAFSDRLLRTIGVVWALKSLAGLVSRASAGYRPGDPASAPKRRIAMLLQEALAGDVFSEDQSDLIDRVCQLSDTPLHTVMVPRNVVKVLSADTDRRGLMRVARRNPHAYFPVFERSRRHVIGLAKVDELLQADDWDTVGGRLHPATAMSAHQTVAAAITHLQRAGRSMAIVTDHGGQMLGIVTLKDLLAEVVGEVAVSV